jgi:hypothetical protein
MYVGVPPLVGVGEGVIQIFRDLHLTSLIKGGGAGKGSLPSGTGILNAPAKEDSSVKRFWNRFGPAPGIQHHLGLPQPD